MSSEDEYTEEEARAAEALALALDERRPSSAPPQDALRSAALIRYSQDGGQLDRERSEAVLAGVLRHQQAIAARKRRRARRLVLSAGIVAAAAALLLVFHRSPSHVDTSSDPHGPASAAPAPSPELINAHLAAIGSAEDRSLRQAMREHRRQTYAALAERYRQ